MDPSGSGPSARRGSAMTYDSFRKKSVLFGGDALGCGCSKRYLGMGWKILDTKSRYCLTPRREHKMAYDIKRDRVVLFGGFTGTGGSASALCYLGTQDSVNTK